MATGVSSNAIYSVMEICNLIPNQATCQSNQGLNTHTFWGLTERQMTGLYLLLLKESRRIM